MQAIYANPMMLPLALYRFWADIFFPSAVKAVDAAIDATTTMPVEIDKSAKQLKRVGRRPHYISARIKARQDAG